MPIPVNTAEDSDPLAQELGDARAQKTAATPRRRPDKRMGVERLIIVLIALTASLALVSDRFYFVARNYDTFVIKQVVPASGLQGWLVKTFGYDPSAYDAESRATLGSPYFPEFDSEDGRRLNATASDYLGIWYYTREIVAGRNPYAISRGIQLVSHGTYPRCEWGDERVDPGLPDQFLGVLSYPPMGPVLILPFYLPNYFASFALYVFSLHLFVLFLAYLLVRRSPGYRLPVALLAVTMFLASYPLGMLIDRGNIEGAVFILVACGLLAYARGHHLTSAVLLGLAASGKVVPAVFLALFLLEGRYKPLAVSVLTACGATLVAMLCMHEPLGHLVTQILHHMDEAKRSMTSGVYSSRFDHSLYSVFKCGLFLYFPHDRASHLAGRLSPFFSVMILGLTAQILFLLRRVSFTNRVLVLTVLMLSFPQISADYKLIHLYIPFGMILLGLARRGWATPAEMATLIILCIIFSPKSYQIGEYTFGFLVNGILLAVLIVTGLRARLGEPVPEDTRLVASIP